MNLADPGADAAIHHALDGGERLNTDNQASQRLADLLRGLAIDGMVVAVVRGSKDFHFVNAIVFNCSQWPSWVVQN